MVADAVTKSLPGPVLKLNRHVMLGHMLAYARVPYAILRSAASLRHSALLCKVPSLRLLVVVFITFRLILPLASTGSD
jgi:hypothetical protein